MTLQIGEKFGHKNQYEAYITNDSPSPKIVVEQDGRVIRQFKDVGDFARYYNRMESKKRKHYLAG